MRSLRFLCFNSHLMNNFILFFAIYFCTLFIDTTSLNKTALDLIEELKSEDPTIDRTGIVSNLVANYPCWFATVVSYQSNNPKYLGKPSYEIKCRANKVVITNSDYQYNPNDFA